jgi:molybdopterin adenylyltransferase
MTDRPARLGILSISDRASRGEYEDRSGPAVRAYLDQVIISPREFHVRLVSDDRELIEAALIELADEVGCDLVVTSGGTGPAPRDVTPEATEAVAGRLLPGFGELMRRVSLDEVPTAILSRQHAAIRGSCLIINLPGSPRAIATCLDAVFAAVPDCVDLIGGARLETDPERVRAYRPHS